MSSVEDGGLTERLESMKLKTLADMFSTSPRFIEYGSETSVKKGLKVVMLVLLETPNPSCGSLTSSYVSSSVIAKIIVPGSTYTTSRSAYIDVADTQEQFV